MGIKKTSDPAFQIKRDIRIDFKEKKLNPSFEEWLGDKFVEEVTMGEDGKSSPRNPTRN